MSQYCYSPLLPGPDSIRLLRLMPREDDNAPTECQLFNYSLKESGKGTHLYEALSYVWGDSDHPCSISVDKHGLPVTTNLYAALSQLRDHSLERIIWVDAVCINQGNLEERSHQVQLMAKIYSKANRVIVWLGETADDSDRAVEEIRLAAGKQSTYFPTYEFFQQAILKLLRRSWFRRIWVRDQPVDSIRTKLLKGRSRSFKKLLQLDMSRSCVVLRRLTATPSA